MTRNQATVRRQSAVCGLMPIQPLTSQSLSAQYDIDPTPQRLNNLVLAVFSIVTNIRIGRPVIQLYSSHQWNDRVSMQHHIHTDHRHPDATRPYRSFRSPPLSATITRSTITRPTTQSNTSRCRNDVTMTMAPEP